MDLSKCVQSIPVSILGLPFDYGLSAIIGSLVAALGLMSNNYSVIIGSMIISPVGGPARDLAFNLAKGNPLNLSNILYQYTLFLVILFSIGFGMGYLNDKVNIYPNVPNETMKSMVSNEFLLTNFTLGLVCGFYGIYAMMKENHASMVGAFLVVSLLAPVVNASVFLYYAYKHRNNKEVYSNHLNNVIDSFKVTGFGILGILIATFAGLKFFCKN